MHVAVLMLNRGRGSGAVARQHSRALRARGHSVTILHPGATGSGARDVPLSSETLPVHEYLPGHEGRQQAAPTMDAATAEAFIADLEGALVDPSLAVDLIIGHHASLTAVAAHRASGRREVPFVLFVHGTGIEPRHHEGSPIRSGHRSKRL